MADAWVELYDEIVRTQNHVRAGNLSKEDGAIALKFFKRREQVLKHQKEIEMFGRPQGGKHFLNSLERKGLYSETQTNKPLPAQIGDESIFCPQRDVVISRVECLDYSGEAAHFDDCKDCDTGKANKRLLCPPQTKL